MPAEFFYSIGLGALIGLAAYGIIVSICNWGQPPMKTHYFHLYRRIRTKDGYVVSTLTVPRDCKNPFVARIAVARDYPGFAVHYEAQEETI